MDLVAYIRVSKVGGREGDSFQSPGQQRKAIEAIVALTPGAHVVAEFEDLDESGGSMDRPGVRRAIEMVESGHADGIVCAYLDRWARTVEALEMIEAWAAQGKAFISARERFDATTSQGKFALGMMLLVAKYYRDLITERWDDSVRNAIGRGVHVRVPYGYRRGDGNGKAYAKGGTRGAPLVLEPDEATIVRRIFTERTQGVGAAGTTEGLNRDGIPSPRGGRWTRQTVRALIRVRAYAGVAHKGAHELAGAHPAIIPPSEWEAAQRERGPAASNGHSPLAGLVRCAGCGYIMGASNNGRGLRRYNCNRHHAEMRCPSPTTAPAETLEQLVVDEFLARYGAVQMKGANAASPIVAETEGALARARAEYEAWRDDVEMRNEIGDADYRAGLLARKQSVTAAERAYGDAIRQTKSDMLSVSEDIWSALDTAERRELMREGIEAIVLCRASSTHTPLTDRVEIVWSGELDHDGTRSGIAGAIRERP
jgi:DNA invertase Pin-like site-specific DNA recombinase